jgi:putative membrane protein
MRLVAPEDNRRIADAIAVAEQATAGEIVAVIAPASGNYLFVPFLWAGLAALALPWPLLFLTWWPVQYIYLLQLAVYGTLLLLLAPWPVRVALVPRSVKHAQAHRRAIAQFLAQNLYTTVGHTGVLIFVSVAEGFAEILADGAISAKVAQSEWDAIVADLTLHIGRGEAVEGFVSAIRAVGAHLARHYPPVDQGGKGKTLPNHLIVLPPA